MKTYRYILLLLPFLFLISACEEEKDKGNLKIQLNAYVGSEPLDLGNGIYNDGAAKEYYFSKLKFYLSHIKLVKDDGAETEIKDVAFFDYSDANWKSFTTSVDAGTYKSIKFSIGLDPTQNATNPLSVSSSEPLGVHEDMHWSWLKYRFVVLEGIADTLGNNFAGGNIGLVYHVGRDDCYRTVTLGRGSFTIDANGEKTLYLTVDLNKVFLGVNSLNMFEEPGTQSEDSDLPLAVKFADRFVESFSFHE